jgi:hypothetical protein
MGEGGALAVGAMGVRVVDFSPLPDGAALPVA